MESCYITVLIASPTWLQQELAFSLVGGLPSPFAVHGAMPPHIANYCVLTGSDGTFTLLTHFHFKTRALIQIVKNVCLGSLLNMGGDTLSFIDIKEAEKTSQHRSPAQWRASYDYVNMYTPPLCL
eukprot:561971-Amphidinium_carterae.1